MAVLSGILGRMGGSSAYDTKYRDWGCSLILVASVGLLWGFNAAFWWVYVLIFLLSWASFTTYWDWLFGYDNMAFSGMMTGLALFPVCFIDAGLWYVVVIRAAVLALVWWCLNKFLPPKVWLWRRDVAEEFSRYASSL